MLCDHVININGTVTVAAAVQLPVTDESRALSNNEYGAPASDGDVTALALVRRETDRGMLDEIHDMEERVCGASLQVKVSARSILLTNEVQQSTYPKGGSYSRYHRK